MIDVGGLSRGPTLALVARGPFVVNPLLPSEAAVFVARHRRRQPLCFIERGTTIVELFVPLRNSTASPFAIWDFSAYSTGIPRPAHLGLLGLFNWDSSACPFVTPRPAHLGLLYLSVDCWSAHSLFVH